jgi:hypothetical protein
MAANLGRDVLKVDALSVPTSSSAQTDYIIIYNINVPYVYFNNPTSAVNVLTQIKNVLVRDFLNNQVVYEISASYQLRHTQTGELRLWTGSFNVRNNVRSRLTGFQLFDPQTFVTLSQEDVEDAPDRLTQAATQDTKWVLHQIVSIIFNAQSKVPYNSALLFNFAHHGRRARRTFAL